MVADTKKSQTLINAAATFAFTVRAAVADLQAVKAKFDAQSPSTAGTPLDGKENAVFGSLSAIGSAINNPVWTDMIAGNVPSHRGEALD